LSLVKQARADNDVVIASIFVNPTQFGPNEDLDRYPRQLERDSELLSDLGVDHLFAPDTMYGPHHRTFVVPEGFDETAEGCSRPGHFRGVATIVTKLFHIVEPTTAYFGQKDACQCVLIRRIVEDLDMGIEISVQDTVRERDGLAMSSRNAYLSAADRKAAPVVYQSLCAARELYDQHHNTTTRIAASDLKTHVEAVLEREPAVTELHYVAVDSRETMQPLEVVEQGSGAIVSVACRLGGVRLIDNIVLK